MRKFIPISPKSFGDKAWKHTNDLRFAAREQMVPVVAQELATAAPEMPTGFIKHNDIFLLVALLSHRSNDNLYVSPEGTWLVQYTPVVLRTYPFRLIRQKGSDKHVLCVDEEAIVNNPERANFFDEAGRPSEAMQKVIKILQAFEQNRQFTASAVQALAERGLIKPWEIKVRTGDQTSSVDGLHKIDELALNRLPDADFLKLRELGAIPLAYAQLLSMQQLHLLGKLAELQSQLRTDPRMQIPPTQIDEMFKLDEETLRF